MHIGFLTDGLGHLLLPQALDVVRGHGLSEVELATGNWSSAPHVDLDDLLSSAARRHELADQLAAADLTLGALNASGNVLHPASGATQDRILRSTIELAGHLGVTKIVLMSGLPAVYSGDRVAPWITTCWPTENGEHLERQWSIVVDYWQELAVFAAEHGIIKLAVEMHANQVVYNAPTLLRLREAIGPIVGANLDPSHLMWMGADPIACVDELAGAIYHVHAKDTRLEPLADTRTRLETRFFTDRDNRAWNYVTLGEGHPGGVAFWADFCAALQRAGYDDVLSIEHEDVAHSPEDGLARAVATLRGSLPETASAR